MVNQSPVIPFDAGAARNVLVCGRSGSGISEQNGGDIYAAMKANGVDPNAPAHSLWAYFITLSTGFLEDRSIAANIIDALFLNLTQYVNTHGVDNCIPIEFLLDEFSEIDTIPDFERKLAAAHNRKISVTIVLEYIGQLQRKYPDGKWRQIIDTLNELVIFSGADYKTAQFIAELIGKTTVTGPAREPEESDSITTNEIMALDIKTCLILHRSQSVTLIARNTFLLNLWS